MRLDKSHNTCEPEESKQNTMSGLQARLLKGIFIRLAEVPLLLSFWGTQLYGEWLMLSAIPAYLSISDGGFAGAACREMTIRSGAGNRNGTLTVFQSTWALLIIVSVVTGLLAIGFVQIVPLEDWLGFSAMENLEARIVLLLLVVHVLTGFQSSLLNGGFWVAGCYPSGMYLITVTQLLEFTGLAVAVASGGGPVQAAAGYLAGRLLGTAFMWVGQRKVSPWLRYGLSHASFGELRRLIVPAFASLAFPLGNALNIQGMRLVIGMVLGPSAVALFVPLRTLSRLVMQPSAIINRLTEPELALAHGVGNDFLFQRLFERSCQLAIWGCLGACFLMGPGAYWIFPEWTGGKIPMHWPAYSLLLSGVLINSVWHTALMVPYATNRHGRISVFYTLIYGGGACGLAFFGTICMGFCGAALAVLFVEVIMAGIVIRESLFLSRMQFHQWISIVLQPPFRIVVKAAATLRE
jgi:O-antigen/teichoic acid export membrane protein